jgi:hypothetical protein
MIIFNPIRHNENPRTLEEGIATTNHKKQQSFLLISGGVLCLHILKGGCPPRRPLELYYIIMMSSCSVPLQ